MDSNLGEPGKDINICLKFCLKMFVMLHIPEAGIMNQEKISTCLKFCDAMVMPPTWVNQGYQQSNILSHVAYP